MKIRTLLTDFHGSLFENSELDLGPKEWPASGDFVLARTAAGGELVDLTEGDIRLWMFWLGLDYILNR